MKKTILVLAILFFKSQEDFNTWVNSDPELRKVREGLREAWGPSYLKAHYKVNAVKKSLGGKIKTVGKRKND